MFRIFFLFVFVSVVSFASVFYILSLEPNRRNDYHSIRYEGRSVSKLKLGSVREFTIDLVLTSASAGSTAYNKTSPPMPLLSDHVKIYQVGTKYVVWIGDKKVWTGSVATQKQRFTISTDASQEKSELYLNGKLVAKSSWSAEVSFISIGKGHNERYWNGTISKFRVYNKYIEPHSVPKQRNIVVQGMEMLASEKDLITTLSRG